jgi:hypothetical protein
MRENIEDVKGLERFARILVLLALVGVLAFVVGFGWGILQWLT